MGLVNCNGKGSLGPHPAFLPHFPHKGWVVGKKVARLQRPHQLQMLGKVPYHRQSMVSSRYDHRQEKTVTVSPWGNWRVWRDQQQTLAMGTSWAMEEEGTTHREGQSAGSKVLALPGHEGKRTSDLRGGLAVAGRPWVPENLSAGQSLGHRDSGQGCQDREGGDQISETREMPNFRIEVPDQDQINPRGSTESQSCFSSSASDWDWFWAL